MAKRRTPQKKKTAGKSKPAVSLMESTKVKSFISKQGRGASTKYKKRLKTYLNVYTKTEKTLDAAMKKTVRELDFNKDNRLRQVGTAKPKKGKSGRLVKGKRLWVDEKTGKRVSGKQVQALVRASIKYKSVKVLAEKQRLTYEQAEKLFNKRVKVTATKIRKTQKFKTEIAKWKKAGMTKREINERITRVAEGRAKSRVIRQINPSPEMKVTVMEVSEF